MTHHVHILRVGDAWDIFKTREEPVITHMDQAWTVAFSPSLTPCPDASRKISDEPQSLVVFSGGDDSQLMSAMCIYHPSKLADDDELIETPYPAMSSVFKDHQAGVTAILPLTLKLADDSTIMVTGSYDDHLRVYKTYSIEGGYMARRPSVIAEENLGGGVWRLKLVKLKESGGQTGPDGKRGWTALILASCMYAGCRVVEISGDYEGDCRISVLARFEEHKSMNYGSDFQPGSEQGGLRCISTSFYDRLLCLWSFGAPTICTI
ncbi:hypothetical protein SLS62_011353 [Diatrype stigma]|uniref:Diphthine methyltransferase n=1 Tax=Diatrype stigma TaxID=117547 RepID=A0AAN9U6T3_9PEZI